MYGINVLENAILLMTPDGPVTGKGTDRLVDRDVGLECEDQDVTGTRTWHADLGIGTLPEVDSWLFDGSNFTGELLTLESSPDNAAWTPRATITPTEDGPQRVTFTALVSPRYWRWTVVDPSLPLKFTEVFISKQITLRWKPSFQGLREPQIPNLVVIESLSGRTFAAQVGERRWSTQYVMPYSPDTDRLLILEFLDAILDGALPFWLLTVTNEKRWVRMAGDVDFQAADRSLAQWDIPLTFVQELP